MKNKSKIENDEVCEPSGGLLSRLPSSHPVITGESAWIPNALESFRNGASWPYQKLQSPNPAGDPVLYGFLRPGRSALQSRFLDCAQALRFLLREIRLSLKHELRRFISSANVQSHGRLAETSQQETKHE